MLKLTATSTTAIRLYEISKNRFLRISVTTPATDYIMVEHYLETDEEIRGHVRYTCTTMHSAFMRIAELMHDPFDIIAIEQDLLTMSREINGGEVNV